MMGSPTYICILNIRVMEEYWIHIHKLRQSVVCGPGSLQGLMSTLMDPKYDEYIPYSLKICLKFSNRNFAHDMHMFSTPIHMWTELIN